jgi:hypothetical protein
MNMNELRANALKSDGKGTAQSFTTKISTEHHSSSSNKEGWVGRARATLNRGCPQIKPSI